MQSFIYTNVRENTNKTFKHKFRSIKAIKYISIKNEAYKSDTHAKRKYIHTHICIIKYTYALAGIINNGG